jgi:hypothetical protein
MCKVCYKCTRGKYLSKNCWGKKKTEASEEDFCNCQHAPGVLRFLSPTDLAAFRINSLRRSLGLEIELCRRGSSVNSEIDIPPFLKTFYVHDGSVRGDAQEMLVAPLVGDQFIEGVTWLAKYFRRANSKADDSCGLHVHVGAGDFGAYEIRRLLWIYRMIEEEIYYKVIDPCRLLNSTVSGRSYCLRFDHPLKWWEALKTAQTSETIREIIYTWVYKGLLLSREKSHKNPILIYPSITDQKRKKYQVDTRYYGLNLHSWFFRKTFEFRMYQGTTEFEDLLYWPLFCGWVVQAAATLTDNEALELRGLKELVEGVWKKPYLTFSFPPPIAKWILTKMKGKS